MTTVKWSSMFPMSVLQFPTQYYFPAPKRLAGSTQLSPIPNEIYLEIFDHLSPSYANGFTESECKHALTNLALVCRFFCAMALPRIFKSLEFSGSLSNEPSAKPSYASFCRAVIKGQEPAASLSLYVKECTFTSWRREDTISDWVSHGFLGMYGQALGRMSNLQSVSLHMVDVDKRFLKAICGLKSLQSLSIQFCSLDRTGNITDRVIQKLTPLKLKSFSYRAFVDDPLQAKVFARIVNTSSLESLQVNSWIVARNIFMEFGMESSLIDLDLSEARDDPIWWKVLDLSKAMKSMRIGRLTRPAGDPSSITPLSPSSMPQLCTLDAPLLLALAIVPGRPLHTIIIPDRPCCSPIRVVEINQLKCSTIPVRVLDISDAISRQISFDFFPQLEVLRLSYNCDHDKQDLCSKPSLFEDVSLI